MWGESGCDLTHIDVYYSRNMGLTGREPRFDGKTRGSQAHVVLERGVHRLALKLKMRLLRLAIALKCEATQACILMLKRDREFRVLKRNTTIAFGTECDPCVVFCTIFAFELKCDPRVDMRLAFEALSSVIFRQPTNSPPKFLKPCG